MHSIKQFIFISCLAVSLFSCTRYTQLYETNTTSPVTKDRNHYVFDNDTIRITYDFWDEKGQFSYEIYNKLSTPIYVDWKKSSFVENGAKNDYWADETFTNTLGVGAFGFYRSVWLYVSNSHAIKPERVLFLAPQSFIRADRFLISPRGYSISQNGYDDYIPIPNHPKRMAKVKYKEYSRANSPLVFRNFMTISLDEKFDKESFVNNTFFVSKICQMKRRKFYTDAIEVNHETHLTSSFKNPTFFYVNL